MRVAWVGAEGNPQVAPCPSRLRRERHARLIACPQASVPSRHRALRERGAGEDAAAGDEGDHNLIAKASMTRRVAVEEGRRRGLFVTIGSAPKSRREHQRRRRLAFRVCSM